MKILEKMLEVETEARQIVEHAKAEANNIRKKAREDAQQLVINGKKDLELQTQQEITKIEKEAAVKQSRIQEETASYLADMEQMAQQRIEETADYIATLLLERGEHTGIS